MKSVRIVDIIKPASTIILMPFLLSVFNCGPKPPGEIITPNTPYNLKAVAGSHSADLYWQISRDDKSPISGYYIYLAESQNAEGEMYNSSPYPGDTDGDITRESIEIPRLENGKPYYAYIRTVFSDGSLSKPSEKVTFVPLAQGKITISQNHTANRSGFNFADEKYTQARDFKNDIYIFATASRSGISSPSRLHSSLRQTKIALNQGEMDMTQPLKKGQDYTLVTADGGRAMLTLLSTKGTAPEIEATFKYVYYPPGVQPR